MNASASTELAHVPAHAFRAIFWAGLTCGVLDITAAFITWAPKGVAPERILRGIASGLLGARAFQGGWDMAALGLTLHFLIAFSAAAVFYLASRKIVFLTSQPVLAGLLYGVAVYVFMYWVVMPLSQLRRGPFSWSATLIAIVTHMFCVGLPIALVMRWFRAGAS